MIIRPYVYVSSMMDAVTKTTSTGRVGSAKPNDRAGHRTAPSVTKEEWVRQYTGRILRAWFRQPAPLGLAWTYANWIRKDLAKSYGQPLKRAFVEETY